MPYTLSDYPNAIEGLPIKAREMWIKVFNSAFEQYKDRNNREALASATAWSQVKAKYRKDEKTGKWVAKEAIHAHGEHACYCPKCEKEIIVAEDVKCNAQSCPDCGTRMRAKDIGERRESMDDLQTKYSELIQEVGKRNASTDEARIKKIIALCNELLASNEAEESKVGEAIKEVASVLDWLKEQKVMKTDDGVKYPADAYAYVPDAEKPSTWKLRLWEDTTKKVTRVQLGKAAAALSPGGFRGNRVEIPSSDLPTVKRKIRAEYRKLDIAEEDIPRWVRETEKRETLTNFVSLEETKLDEGIATVTIITPGFNEGNGRFYPAEVLKRDYGIFEGAKMYADHPTETEEKARPERSIRDWVGTLTNVEAKEDGKIIGKATIVEPWLQEKLARLRDSKMLSEMGISINAIGSASDAEIEGIKTKLVEKLIKARSVDFVTEPGAGGSVDFYEVERFDIELIELNQLKEMRPDLVKAISAETKAEIYQEVKKTMEMEEKVKELEGQIETLTTERDEFKTKIEEAEKAKAIAETKAKLDEALGKSELPEPAKARILEKFQNAETADGIEEAIKAEAEYIAQLSESGKVRGLGESKISPEESHKQLIESFKALGMDDEAAGIAAKGR